MSEFRPSPEHIGQRVESYLLPPEVQRRYEHPTEDDLELRRQYRSDSPGADFSVVSYHGALKIVPPWHALNRTPRDIKGIDYARSVFEGSSFIPVTHLQEPTLITHGNLVLHAPRMKRLHESLSALGYDVRTEELSQAVFDLAAILGETVLRTDDGLPSRAYIRPRGTVGKNGWGVAGKPDDPVELGAIMFNWPFYFKDPERIYHGDGLKALIFMDKQRHDKIIGKLSGNYPVVGGVSARAKEMGYDEALILAPHGHDPRTGGIEYMRWEQGVETQKRMRRLQHFSDGPGEGIIAVVRKGQRHELWYPPSSVNQLKSTTMAYVVDHLGPELGFEVVERPFGFYDMAHEEMNIIMVGNAALLAPVGQIGVFQPDTNEPESEPIIMPIMPETRMLAQTYQDQLAGKVASHPSLLMAVDLDSSEASQAREMLYGNYGNYFK